MKGPPQHKLLERQLRKHQIIWEELPENIQQLLNNVGETYQHFEQEYNLIERSIDISSEELIETNIKLRKQAMELKNTNKELGELAYAMSHDLKEPLRSITMHLQMIKRIAPEVNRPDVKVYFDYVIDSSQRMFNMLSAMLNYAKINTAHSDFTRVDLNMILQQVTSNLSHMIQSEGAQIHIPKKLPAIKAEETQMVQLFQNLIANAIKFNHGHAVTVEITWKREKGAYHFSVTDNGKGTLIENPNRLFEMFKMYHPDDHTEGIGMGLAICKKIVSNHEGNILIDHQYSDGFKIDFSLR